MFSSSQRKVPNLHPQQLQLWIFYLSRSPVTVLAKDSVGLTFCGGPHVQPKSCL